MDADAALKLKQKLTWVEPGEHEYPISEFERFKKRMLRNPLVPIGFFATVAALTIGLKSFFKGKKQKSQIMMRWRVGLQAATVGVLIAGLYVETLLGKKDENVKAD